MASYLHPNFLRDEGQYKQAEACWNFQWENLIDHAGDVEGWEVPWAQTTFADGTPWRDGNPIFSAVCRTRKLAIRVIQLEPSGNPREIDFWTDTFAKGEPEALNELVISCVLTEYTLHYAVDLMYRWVRRGEVHLARKHDDYMPILAPPVGPMRIGDDRAFPLLPQPIGKVA